jgi:16S rRNA (cytidine1402-2'-O)-methyltransferase
MLYIIPTPIGNLQDITLRALDTLKAVDGIFCEDTRRTQILLSHFGISKPTYRYNENDDHSVARCLEWLKSGKNFALVSDCGTPCISDPGWKLVRAAVAEQIAVTSLAGPSAVACALAGAGLTGGAFTFLGFLPRKAGKAARLLQQASALKHPVVVYESPYRVVKMLDLIAQTLGENTPVVAARELTKVYEEYLRGTAAEVAQTLRTRKKVQGEFVLIIDCFDTTVREDEDEGEDL